ncbi:MAG: NTP transferase domain-containing protein [Phycisphaerales bacterium]
MSVRATAIIPARVGSTRFARKALADATGKALVVHVCERAAAAASVGRVVVACDADEIAAPVREAGFEAVLTSPDHENGTSRLAEAAEVLKLKRHDVIVNVQGDEPEIEAEIIDAAVLAIGVQTPADQRPTSTPAAANACVGSAPSRARSRPAKTPRIRTSSRW